MAIRRAQVTTYFADDNIDDWDLVKQSFGDAPDAVILRKLVQDKARELRGQPQVELSDLLARIEALEEWRRSIDRG